MAADIQNEQTATDDEKKPYTGNLDELVPAPDDPGGSHSKGYSADPRPDVPVPEEDPIPLVTEPTPQGGIHQPEKEGKTQATGRQEPGNYTPNDRLMGSDR